MPFPKNIKIVLGKLDDVGAVLTKGLDVNGYNRDAIEEIFAESTRIYSPLKSLFVAVISLTSTFSGMELPTFGISCS